ncbi:MAG TPA: proton-conducting transporter membrane subunit [Chloroflexota bacterium]|nr:proton-conducting transporter membrane subunit [Chloroflexota bacterium]
MTFPPGPLPYASLLALVAAAVLVAGFAEPLTKRPWAATTLALAGAAAAGLVAAFGSPGSAGLTRLIVYVVSAFVFIVLLLIPSFELEYHEQRPESIALLLLAGTGAIVLATGGDLLSLVIGTEILSLSSALLIVLGHGEAVAEAAFKYFVLAAISLATLVYGLGLVYLGTGSLGFPAAPNSAVTFAGLVLLSAGFAFELALVPLHWGALDVYTAGAPAASGAVMALSKLGAVAALVRVVSLAGGDYPFVFAMVGLLTAVWATFAALAQREIRRLLGYSAIAHAGFLAMAIGSGPAGRAAALFYVIVYGATALLVFASLAGLGPEPIAFAELPRRLGLGRSLALCFGLMSLAGIPPLPGFWAKLALFGPAWHALGPVPAFIGVAAAVAAAVYYLMPVPDLWNALRLPTERARATPAVALAALAVLSLTVAPGFLWGLIG